MAKAFDGHTADAGIPQLSRLTDAREAERLLNAALSAPSLQVPPWLAGGGELLSVRAVKLLRGHAASRWTLRYAVRRGGEERSLIAKVYARDRGDVANLLWSLRARELGAGQPMQVPAPVAYLPELRLLLLEEAPGAGARAALRRGDPGIEERTAGWLAAFHAAAPLPATSKPRDPLDKGRRCARALSKNAPELAGEARRLLDALLDRQPSGPPQPQLIHGDFSVSHVYIAEQTTTVIDWDSWKVGDPAEDAGRFMASLHHLAARDPARHIAAASTFARSYRAAVPAARASLAFYEALACLRTAARLTAGHLPRRVSYARTLLAHGARALTAGHPA